MQAAVAHTESNLDLDLLALLADKLEQLTPRARIRLLLHIGVPAVSVMGVERCADHVGWRPLRDVESLAFDGTVVWCQGCHTWRHK